MSQKPTTAVLLVTAAWGCMLVAFLVLTPPHQGPDEPLHIDRILDTGAFTGFEAWDEGETRIDVLQSLATWGGVNPRPFRAGEAPPHPRPTFRALGPDDPQDGINQQTQHPPLYYSLMGGLRTGLTGMTPDDWWTADREITLLRVLNLLMVLPLPLLAHRAARELGWDEQRATLAALVPLVIPQLAWMGVTVNNDNLLTLTAAVAFVASCRILRRGLELRSGVVFAVAVGLSLMTKASALVLLAYVALVVVVAWRRHGGSWRLPALVAGIAAAGAWFYAVNVLTEGDYSPGRGSLVYDPDAPTQVRQFAENFLRQVSSSFWGHFGWLTHPMPRWWTAPLTVALVVVLVMALVRRRPRNVRILLAPAALALALLVYVTFDGHVTTGLYPAMQGRYLFFVLVPVALGVAAALGPWPRAARRGLSVVAVAGYAIAVAVLVGAYWGGRGVGRLDSLTAWSPFGDLAAVLVVAASGGLVACLVVADRVADRGAGRARRPSAGEPAASGAAGPSR